MASILDRESAKSLRHQEQFRLTYLRMMGAEYSYMQADLRDIAEREIVALARLIAKLDAPPRRK